MAKKDFWELLSDLKNNQTVKLQDYTKSELANAAIYLASEGLSNYSDDEISKEFYKRYKNNVIMNSNHDLVLITKEKINSYKLSKLENVKKNLDTLFDNKPSTVVEQGECKTVRLDKDQFDALVRAIYLCNKYNEGDNCEKQ